MGDNITPEMARAELARRRGANAINPINNRPNLANTDGSFSTEESVTLTHPALNQGRPTNVPSIWGGKRFDNEDQIVQQAIQSGQQFQSFNSIDEAVAKSRSNSLAAGIPRQRITPEMARRELARRQQTDGGVAGRIRVISSGLVEGVPIAGPLIKGASDRIAAGFQAGPMDWATGESTDDVSYGDALAAVQGRTEDLREAHPVLDIGSQVIGSIVSTGGMAAPAVVGTKAAQIGAKALGLTGKTLPARVATASGSGSAVAGADTLARGGDGEDALRNMVVGGTVAGAIPAIGSGIRKGVEGIRRTVRGATRPKTDAISQVSEALVSDRIEDGVMSSEDIAAARVNGQPITVGDIGGEGTKGLARTAANVSPAARDVMGGLSDRFGAQHTRATDFVSDIVGGKVDDLAYQDGLRAAAAKLNKPRYDRAYNSPAAQGMWDDEFADLMQSDTFRKAARAATKRSGDRAALAGGSINTRNPFVFAEDGSVTMAEGVSPNLQFWDNVKRGLDDIQGSALRSGNKSFAGDANALRRALIQKLDASVPEYAKARAGAAAAFGAEDALDAGRKAVNMRMKNAELARAVHSMNKAEKEAFRVGYASELIDRVRAIRERTDVINSVFGSPEAKAKFKLILGEQKFKELEAFIRIENAMKMLKDAVSGNSTTSRQLYEMAGSGLAGGMYSGDFTGAMVGAGLAKGRHLVQGRIAKEIAEVLMSQDPAMVAALVRKAGSNQTALYNIRQMEKQIAAVAVGAGVATGNVTTPSRQ